MIKPLNIAQSRFAAYDDATLDNRDGNPDCFTLAELIDHANGCEEQIDFLLAEIEAKDKRIAVLEADLKHVIRTLESQPANDNTSADGVRSGRRPHAGPCRVGRYGCRCPFVRIKELEAEVQETAPKNPNERLVDCFRELVDLQLFAYPPNSVAALDDAVTDLEGVVAKLLVTGALDKFGNPKAA